MGEYRKAMILVILLHIYLITKALYFAWALKKKETQAFIKCCLQCWCCYTAGVSIYIQVVYFKYGPDCQDTVPKTTQWLMIEVIIFYSYIFVECITAVSIFVIMLRKHNRHISEQQKKLNALKDDQNTLGDDQES